MRVTIVPIDQIIIVDRDLLVFEYSTDSNIHAIQWLDDKGHIEYKDGRAHKRLSGPDDFDEYVLPFVKKWETERERVLAELQALEEQPEEEIAQEQPDE